MENTEKEKNKEEIKKRDMLFPASIVIATLLLSFAWIYTSGLEARSGENGGKVIQAVDSHGHEIQGGQQAPRRSAGCGV